MTRPAGHSGRSLGAAARLRRRFRQPFGPRRVAAAYLAAIAGPALTTWWLTDAPPHPDVAANLPLFLVSVVGAGATGGTVPGLVAAMWSAALANYWLTEPYRTLTIADRTDLTAVILFFVIAIIVGMSASRAARRAAAADITQQRAELLARLTGIVVDNQGVEAVLDQLREAFRARSVTLTETTEPPRADDTHIPIGAHHVLELHHAAVFPGDEGYLAALRASVRLAIQRATEADAEAERQRLDEANRLRQTLLSAVSHELRTPLTIIKANASTLADPGLDLSADVQRELARSIEHSADRLSASITDLLDLGRLRAGTSAPRRDVVELRHIVADALSVVDTHARAVEVLDLDSPVTVGTDAAIATRIVANLIDNACKWNASDEAVRIEVGATDAGPFVSISDRGPGQLGPVTNGVRRPRTIEDAQRGSGIGLTVSIELAEFLGAAVRWDERSGGGLLARLEFHADAAEPASL